MPPALSIVLLQRVEHLQLRVKGHPSFIHNSVAGRRLTASCSADKVVATVFWDPPRNIQAECMELALRAYACQVRRDADSTRRHRKCQRTSIIAASLYFCTFRTILIATYSLFFRSQHSSTRPNVPMYSQSAPGQALDPISNNFREVLKVGLTSSFLQNNRGCSIHCKTYLLPSC